MSWCTFFIHPLFSYMMVHPYAPTSLTFGTCFFVVMCRTTLTANMMGCNEIQKVQNLTRLCPPSILLACPSLLQWVFYRPLLFCTFPFLRIKKKMCLLFPGLSKAVLEYLSLWQLFHYTVDSTWWNGILSTSIVPNVLTRMFRSLNAAVPTTISMFCSSYLSSSPYFYQS